MLIMAVVSIVEALLYINRYGNVNVSVSGN